MAVQRSVFELVCGINRPGDTVDTVIPSPARAVSKAMDIGGCFAFSSADDAGDVKFKALIEGSNNFDGLDPLAADWQPVFLAASTLLVDAELPDTQFVNPITQVVSVLQFSFIRLTVFVVSGNLATVDNLQIVGHFKFDYQTG